MSHEPSLLAKVARAVERGTLPKELTISYGTGGIAVNVPWIGDYGNRQRITNRTLTWLERTFPEGSSRLNAGRSRPQRRYRQKPLWLDEHQWADPHWALTFKYERLHEHRAYKADTRDTTLTGNSATDCPIWRCVDCGKPITTTRARELNLLPPKATR